VGIAQDLTGIFDKINERIKNRKAYQELRKSRMTGILCPAFF
jgi:hypothetical protein